MNNTHTKRAAALLTVLLLGLLLLTGCVRSGVGILWEANDTGVVEISVGIKEEYYNILMEQMANQPEGTENSTDIFSGETTSILTEGDDTYICMVEHKKFTDLDELKQILLELQYDFDGLGGELMDSAEPTEDDLWLEETTTVEETEDTHIFTDAVVSHDRNLLGHKYHISLTTKANKEANAAAMDMLGFTDNAFKLVVAVTMPGEVTAEGGTVNENTATFVVTDLAEAHTLTATSETTDILGLLALGLAVVVLVIIVIVMVNRKENKYDSDEE